MKGPSRKERAAALKEVAQEVLRDPVSEVGGDADGLAIPGFLRAKKPKRRLEIVPGVERKIDWVPISHTHRRSAAMENMRRLAKRPEAPVIAVLREGDREFEKKFKSMDAFLDDFYSERVHKYLGMNSGDNQTVIYVDVSGEAKMRRRFEDLKSRRNPAAVVSNGESAMSAKKKAAKKSAKPAKPERKLIGDPRYDGKKLTRILQKDLPEGTKALQKTSPHWGAYIYVARKPGVTFESYANDAKHPIASLTTLVEAGHVVLK